MVLETPDTSIADGKLFLTLPTNVVHRVDSASPLSPGDFTGIDDFQYCLNALDYLEILVVVSASCPVTGNSLEARHSYTKECLGRVSACLLRRCCGMCFFVFARKPLQRLVALAGVAVAALTAPGVGTHSTSKRGRSVDLQKMSLCKLARYCADYLSGSLLGSRMSPR